MPRWLRGLHVPAGALPALGTYQARVEATDQREYWRHAVAELHAGASVAWPPGPAPNVPNPFNPAQGISASTGPQGAGERWQVDLVQVSSGDQYGQPPLVVQQIAGQAAGTTTTPPPPIVAQAWLAVAGQNVHLLAQTTQGGNDDMGLGGQELSAGEAIAVVWYGLAPNMPAWFRLRGIKYTLDT